MDSLSKDTQEISQGLTPLEISNVPHTAGCCAQITSPHVDSTLIPTRKHISQCTFREIVSLCTDNLTLNANLAVYCKLNINHYIPTLQGLFYIANNIEKKIVIAISWQLHSHNNIFNTASVAVRLFPWKSARPRYQQPPGQQGKSFWSSVCHKRDFQMAAQVLCKEQLEASFGPGLFSLFAITCQHSQLGPQLRMPFANPIHVCPRGQA